MTLDIRWLAPAAILAIAATPTIAATYMSVEQARALIFPLAKEFVAAPLSLTTEQIKLVTEQSGIDMRGARFKVWRAEAAGKLIGWFFIDQVIGKHEYMTYAAGIYPDGKLHQFQLIEYREAYGYQVRELKWRDQFVGKTVTDKLELGVDIANISGATLSCRHLTDGIKQLLAIHHYALR